ncbi:hypothetical protein KUTeg_015554, partial [Tegillarca granosa]
MLFREICNITTRNDLRYSDFEKEAAGNVSLFDWKHYSNYTIRRQFRAISDIGMDACPDNKILKRKSIYMSIKSVKRYPLNYTLTRLKDILASSRNYDELLAVWKRWRDESGKKMKTKYRQFVTAMNKAIKFSGYKDVGEYWRSWYEVDTFEDDMRNLFDELEPLYKELHGYVRNKLMKYYGAERFPDSGHIPAHLLGNMWAQFWHNIYDLVEPYPENFNTTYMWQLSDQFYTSMGLPKMPQEFWSESLLKKPDDREVVGIASAWDFGNRKDFRILQSTTVSEDQFLVLHHEMGHIVYFLAYKDQPFPFRAGANPGFHEAMGDLVHLSLNTPEHLKTIGIIVELPQDNKGDINYLMRMALEKIAFLPFGYLIDQWRWDVFRGTTSINNYNKKWWQLRYFISHVLQFQMHKALCDEIDHTGPLHRCNLYGQKDAGFLLSEMLKLGSSKHWQDALEVLTGERQISVRPLVEFFNPLLTWLREQNKGQSTGWTPECP